MWHGLKRSKIEHNHMDLSNDQAILKLAVGTILKPSRTLSTNYEAECDSKSVRRRPLRVGGNSECKFAHTSQRGRKHNYGKILYKSVWAGIVRQRWTELRLQISSIGTIRVLLGARAACSFRAPTCTHYQSVNPSGCAFGRKTPVIVIQIE